MLPFGFAFVLETAAPFLAEEGGGLVDLVFVAAMAEGFDGGGTDGGTARVKGDLEEVAPGDGGRPTSGCFRESRGFRNMRCALVWSNKMVADGIKCWLRKHSS